MNKEILLKKLYTIKDEATARYGGYPLELTSLIGEVKAEIRFDAAKSKGSGGRMKVINNLLKENRKRYRAALNYAWIDERERQCVCDGYRAFRFEEDFHLPLEPRPLDAGEPLNLTRLYPQDTLTYREIELPSYEEVKVYVAQEKAKKSRAIIWDFGPDLPAVNARYLLDALTVFPDCKTVWVEKGPGCMVKPLLFKTDEGDGLLLPVRMSEKMHKEENEDD